MAEEDRLYKQGKKKKGMDRKAKGECLGFDKNKKVSGLATDADVRPKTSFKHRYASESQPIIVRKQVDPDTAKYFSEIWNLFESKEVDLDERAVICGNALEEARGKEFELATDYILSHTLQALLEGCDVDHLCGFLRGCGKVFPLIAMDRSGSHVAETALKSLVIHLEDNEAYSVIEDTLSMICKVVVVNPVDIMCNRYGSHVLRSLLCLLGGLPLDSPEFHGRKPSSILAERLNLGASRLAGNDSRHLHREFPTLLKFVVSEMLKCTKNDVKILQLDQYSSLVLQTALKLLAKHDQELFHVIPNILGLQNVNVLEGNFIETGVNAIVELMKETAFSHLMEVILDVTPDSLYDEMLGKVFRNSLFELSSHHCGNFVVQALVSRARDPDQMDLIWEELGSRFSDLLEMGRSGVIASLFAASQRLHTHEQKCCEALTAAIRLPNEGPGCIIPRILFLDSYFACDDKANWNLPRDAKIHVMGSLILQAIFRFQSEFVQPYITSLTSMEVEHVIEVAKDGGGARVIEAFLDSNTSAKLKRRLIMKLRGHFGELAMHSSGSFTVEKCFAASNASLREDIASDLLAVKLELSKTKQGPYLLRRLDIDGYANRPDQWRSKQVSKESAYNEFCDTFGSSEPKSSRKESFLAYSSKNTSHPKEVNKIREEIDYHLASQKYGKHGMLDKVATTKNKKMKNKKSHAGYDINGASKKVPCVSRRPFLSVDLKGMKRGRDDRSSKASAKKLKL
ncbi:hypothetical protein K2173_009678 [Erythroxylum novogranatense]|uniref:Uncharacterized protein n=1 Tax=Erythroxylum novogranatense TaxID=1862640 RepID=A0AAV8U4K2_9ROSI|nr:hypothetical protein K2173_009678 [Erythroxylum novogranatense]